MHFASFQEVAICKDERNTIILPSFSEIIKPGIALLIIGGVMLGVGLVVAGVSTFSVTKQVLKGSTIINETTLQPNVSFGAVMKNLPAGQQLVLSLSSEPSDVLLQAQIVQPNGTALSNFPITETPFTSTVTTVVSGDHTVQIKNVGSKTVTIKGAVINSPIAKNGGGVSVQDNPSLQSLISFGIAIIVGIILVIAGIVILIIGAIKYARGRKAPPPGSSV